MILENAILTIFLAFSGVGGAGGGADSVHTEIIDTLTVLQAERLLAERNTELRLARLACTEAEANARQARRWENPEVSGIYNLYNRYNPFLINFEDSDDGARTRAVQYSLFGIVPSISYNFKF